MTQQIGSLLDIDRFAEPEEVKVIRKYLRDKFDVDAEITVQPNQIIIAVKGAALAGALRLKLHELQKLCGTSRRLMIRIL